MHILYLHQYFATPRGSSGTRSYEFARRWVAAGHHVTVVTSGAQLTAAEFADGPSRRVTRLTIEGIDVVVLNIKYHQTMGVLRRLCAFARFMVRATWHAVRLPDIDVVYASSTPLSVGVCAWVARCLRGRRYVFEVRDAWPAVPIALGLIRNSMAIALLRKLERVIYHRAEAIVALSPGTAELVRAQASQEKRIETIPNAADTDVFHPRVAPDPVRRRYGWNGRFVCLHTGAMGRVNGLDIVLRAARHFRDDGEFLFVLIGEGRQKQPLTVERDRLGLSNLQILDTVPKRDLPEVLAAADVCLMTVTNVALLEHNSANKFFDYLSAGKPVLLNYGGWQRDVLQSAGAGLGCRMGDEQAFFDNLAALKADRVRCREMGCHARRLAVEKYDRDALAARALSVLVDAAGR